MTVQDFDIWVKNSLPMQEYKKTDASLNGLQVGSFQQEITKMSFALDACQSSIAQAVKEGSQILFVHHGLFWGPAEPIVGSLRQQVANLIQNDISLYAVHLPLDAVREFGNNDCIANILNLQNCQPFADIGVIGNLPTPLTTGQIAAQIFPHHSPLIWDNSAEINRVAIIVGGGAKMAPEAVRAGADCYITGEPLHQVFHLCLESHLSFIAGGHYQSEMIGLEKFKSHVEQAFPNLQTHLIDIPTGV